MADLSKQQNSVLSNINPYVGVAESAFNIYQNMPYRHMNNYIDDKSYYEPQINQGSLYLDSSGYADRFGDVKVLKDNIKGNFGRDIGQGAKLGASAGAALGSPLLGAGLGALGGLSMAVGKRIDDIEFGDSGIANLGEKAAKAAATVLTGPFGFIGRGMRRKREREAKDKFNKAKTAQIDYLDDYSDAHMQNASYNNAMDRYRQIQQQYRSPDSIYL